MILEKSKDAQVTVMGGGRTSNFTISQKAIAHTMDMLSQLYSDPYMAVIREYTTNAVDSHIAAGKKETSIHINLPTRFTPMFTIRDFGIGLSEEEVYEIYTSYGASTKQQSNDFNGQLGFGCKSAFAVSRQFSLTSVKDGIRNVFSMYKNEDNEASVTLIDSTETDEPNGVTVAIPIDYTRIAETTFADKVRGFLETLGFPVIFDDKEFVPAAPLATVKINDEITFHLKSRRVGNQGNVNIRMGGVLYPIPHEVKLYIPQIQGYGSCTYIDVPIGSVNFTPSREALKLNAKTMEYLAYIESEVNRAIENETRKAAEIINAADSLEDAVSIFNGFVLSEYKTCNAFRNFSMKYRDKFALEVSSSGHTTKFHEFLDVVSYTLDDRGFLSRGEQNVSTGFVDTSTSMYIVAPHGEISAKAKSLAKQILSDKDEIINRVVFVSPNSFYGTIKIFSDKYERTNYHDFIDSGKVKKVSVLGAPTVYSIRRHYQTLELGLSMPITSFTSNGQKIVLVEVHGNDAMMHGLPITIEGLRYLLNFAAEKKFVLMGLRTVNHKGEATKNKEKLDKYLKEVGESYISFEGFMQELLASLPYKEIRFQGVFNKHDRILDMLNYFDKSPDEESLPSDIRELMEIRRTSFSAKFPIHASDVNRIAFTHATAGTEDKELEEKIRKLKTLKPLLTVIEWDALYNNREAAEEILAYIKGELND